MLEVARVARARAIPFGRYNRSPLRSAHRQLTRTLSVLRTALLLATWAVTDRAQVSAIKAGKLVDPEVW